MPDPSGSAERPAEMKVTVTENGPYEVEGDVPLARWSIVPNDRGESWDWRKEEDVEAWPAYRLCRCGGSSTKPFCDNSHLENGFNGTESASREPFLEQARAYKGPVLTLADASALCASSRFCDVGQGVWRMVKSDDEEAVALVERQSKHCVAGRLVAWRRAADTPLGEELEDDLEPSIGVVEDRGIGVSGPLWVRGGITIVGADGTAYEIRNRVALCRCGASENKPFCDGSHISVEFRDESVHQET